MKKTFLCIVSVIVFIFGCSSGAKSVNKSDFLTLDQTLKEAAAQIDERVPARSKIAPLNFNSLHDKFSDYVLDELTACLLDTRKLTVVDRKEIDLISKETNFQYSGEVEDKSMQDLGRKLGAQSIISGSLTDMGGFYRIVIRVLNVQSAAVEVQYRANIENNKIMTALLTGGRAAKTTSAPRTPAASSTVAAPAAQTTVVQAPAVPAQTTPVPAAPVAPPTPVYKIGDKGPAGGIIFYDKGNNSGGWRYLEAAPAGNEFTATWNPPGQNPNRGDYRAEANDHDIGKGFSNTRAIVNSFSSQYGAGFNSAAWECNDLIINGFDDWFLPSTGELNFMYGNLHRRGLGGFKSNWYWSSTVKPGKYPSAINFQDGATDVRFPPNSTNVRAIRQF